VSVDGTWTITIKTPMGPQVGTLEVTSDGGALVGTMTARGETVAIAEGSVDGDDVRWVVKRKRPLPMTATFTARLAGDEMAGRAKLGPMGESALHGVRDEPRDAG
jgi:hypothetical protein